MRRLAPPPAVVASQSSTQSYHSTQTIKEEKPDDGHSVLLPVSRGLSIPKDTKEEAYEDEWDDSWVAEAYYNDHSGF